MNRICMSYFYGVKNNMINTYIIRKKQIFGQNEKRQIEHKVLNKCLKLHKNRLSIEKWNTDIHRNKKCLRTFCFLDRERLGVYIFELRRWNYECVTFSSFALKSGISKIGTNLSKVSNSIISTSPTVATPTFLLSNKDTRVEAIRIFKKLPDFFCFLIIIGNEMGHYYFLGSHFTNHTTSNLFSVPDRDIPSSPEPASVFFRILVSLLMFFMTIFLCVWRIKWIYDDIRHIFLSRIMTLNSDFSWNFVILP